MPCPVSCISGHCSPGNGSCVWGCNPYNCLNYACNTANGVCSQGCKIGLEGDFCDRCECKVLFPIVLANDCVKYHTSTYNAPGDNMFIISIRGIRWSHKGRLYPPLFTAVECERSCICFSRRINCASFYEMSILFCKCSDMTILSLFFLNCIVITHTSYKIIHRQFVTLFLRPPCKACQNIY